ncbi:leucyl aminopeptidase family protein [Neolewinella antarctica]|uniref:Leucyl aminopeptidase n=1 Tax=Neolewinella antarctica TaxID=442734 RepID=A0ABX0XD80_9BACT|nr:leucyl aminopeptidase family protein [Neolewinella antarctica]NJC26732.1 leucyl aminopeptidase [Neolewinella antarctica]
MSDKITRIRLITHDASELRGVLEPGAYLRTLDPLGYVYRLPEDAKTHQVRYQARLLSHREAKQFTGRVEVDNSEIPNDLAAAFAAGLYLGTYRPNIYKSEVESHPLAEKGTQVSFKRDEKGLKKASEHEMALAETQLRIMVLVDAPANVKRPQYLADWAKASGKQFGYGVKVLDEKACEKEGFGALLAVNRGSEDPARFIIMEHKGGGAGAGAKSKSGGAKRVVVIGKGITFDTGGISIKGSANLHLMKSDMGGAAAVFGMMEVAAKLDLPVHLIGIVPCTDNSVDALSIKPSDVITGHSGKTIEIIDTDAEGRLVMSDGLSYGNQHYSPDYLLDIATLTGSAVRTFGYECAAVISKNEELVTALRTAGDASGDRVWPLPGWDEYRSGLDSDVADIKNFTGKPINGAIDAFKFLEFFTDEHPAFAHLDIAGVGIKQGPFAKDRQATGFGMRLLITWLEGLAG